MATCVWTGGAGDGNATTAGNWDTGVPVAGDTVYINATNQNITTGLGSVALALCVIGERYTGNLTVALTTGTITTLYYRSGGQYGRINGSVTTGTVEIPRSRTLYIDSGTIGGTRFMVASGNIEVAAAAVLTNCYNGMGTWTIYSNATKVTTFVNAAGRVISDGRNIGAYDGWAGSSLELRSSSAIADGSSGGVARLSRGATLTFAGTGGTHDIIHNAGTVDANPVKSAQTITTLFEYPQSLVKEDVPGYTLTVTNRHKVGGSASGVGGPIPL